MRDSLAYGEAGAYTAEHQSAIAAVEVGNFWFESRRRLIVWALDRYFPSARSFLDVGCGTGFVLDAVSRARPAMALAGSDLGDAGFAYVRARVPGAALFTADARTLRVPDPVDVLGCFDVLEHLDDDRAALASMAAAVAPGGGLLLTVPQHPWLWSQVDDFAGHMRRYRRRELVDRVSAAGFTVLRATSFVSVLLPVMAAVRLRERRGRFTPMPAMRLPSAVQAAFSAALAAERAAIRAGVSWPAGGSLLVVARRT